MTAFLNFTSQESSATLLISSATQQNIKSDAIGTFEIFRNPALFQSSDPRYGILYM